MTKGVFPDDLYEFPSDHVGRKQYVSVRGHSRSIPKYKTYRGYDGYNYVRPEFGGSWDGLGETSTFIMRDKSAYFSPIDNTVVEGRAAHREHMKRHNVIEAGDMKLGEFSGVDRAPMPRAGYDIKRAIAELSSR